MSELTILSRDWSFPVEVRSSLENPQTPLSFPSEWLLDIFNGGRTDSGIRVSEFTAFQVSTFLACVDIIAGKISSLPRHIYERTFLPNGRPVNKISYEHDYYDLITSDPNPEMSGNTFLYAFLCHCLAWSNGYAEIQRDSSRYAVGLWPRNPAKTRPFRLLQTTTLEPVAWRPYPVTLPIGTLCYQTTDHVDDAGFADDNQAKSYTPRLIPAEDMLHVPGVTFDGRVGMSVVWLARQTLGLALAMDKFGAKYFANFARPGGILMTPAGLAPVQQENARRSWMEAQGGENAHRVAVMPSGYEWKAISSNPQEAQTDEAKRTARHEICAFMHVPPHMVGEEEKGKSSTEQLAQELKEYCLDRWMSSVKMELKRKLFPHRKVGRTPRNMFHMDFDLHEMLRPTAEAREKFYAGGRQWSYLNANDVREREKMNPIMNTDGTPADWAEEYIMPINMTLTTTPVDPTFQDGAGNGTVPAGRTGSGGGAGGDKGKSSTAEPAPAAPKKAASTRAFEPLSICYSSLFSSGFRALLASSERDLDVYTFAFSPTLFAIRDTMYAEAMREFRTSGIPVPNATSESARFISSYLVAMERRGRDLGTEWNADMVDVCQTELKRAISAIRVTVFREVAAEVAKAAGREIEANADADADADADEQAALAALAAVGMED